MNIIKRSSRKGDKEYYYFEFGRCAGSRIGTKIFTYTYPKNQIEKNHNKEALKLLETKKSELNIEQQAANIKKYLIDRKNDRIALVSESSQNYFPIFIHKEDDFRIIGKVIDVVKKL